MFYRLICRVSAACLVLALTLVLPVAQAAQAATALEGDQPAQATEMMSGHILSVDPKNLRITIEYVIDEASQTMAQETYLVDDQTEFLQDDQVIGLAGLKPDDVVTVEYTTAADGMKLISTIWVED